MEIREIWEFLLWKRENPLVYVARVEVVPFPHWEAIPFPGSPYRPEVLGISL